MKNLSKPIRKIFYLFFALSWTITITLISFSPPCRAEQPGASISLPGEQVSKQIVAMNVAEVSPIEQRISEEKKVYASAFALIPHRQNYILPFTYDSHPNKETYEFASEDEPKNYEVKFQLSFKIMLWKKIFGKNGDLFYAYTQRSFWQLYDKSLSSPFRETNHEPEIFVKFDTDFNMLGLRNKLFLFGFNHQSNGRGGVLSRSWNRLYADIISERGNFVIGLKAWYRIPEDEEDDDNPDIEKYMGYGELFGAYRLKKHVFSFMLRNNLREGENKGAVELGWSYPISHNVRVCMQYFNGYGESLVDYNDSANRIGIGVMLFDWI